MYGRVRFTLPTNLTIAYLVAIWLGALVICNMSNQMFLKDHKPASAGLPAVLAWQYVRAHHFISRLHITTCIFSPHQNCVSHDLLVNGLGKRLYLVLLTLRWWISRFALLFDSSWCFLLKCMQGVEAELIIQLKGKRKQPASCSNACKARPRNLLAPPTYWAQASRGKNSSCAGRHTTGPPSLDSLSRKKESLLCDGWVCYNPVIESD